MFLTLLASVCLGATGQLCIKKGVTLVSRALGEHSLSVGLILQNPLQTFLNPFVLGGFLCYGASSLLWLTLVSRYPLSLVYPMVALGYVVVVLGSMLFFRDRPNAYTWVALAMIVAGVSLLARAGGQQ